ncbi:MAG: 50S ribosomal protein L35 [Candidatus Omnitrophica bacterium]|nr:50S ribosomal protein L35 [Candidatus Omnitrophota bacterium]
MLKTKKGVAKRFKLTRKGKLKYYKSAKSHLLTNKDSKRLRRLRRAAILGDKRQIRAIKKMLPYG